MRDQRSASGKVRRWRKDVRASRKGWLAGVDTNFRAEREARRAGLTGKITKHRAAAINQLQSEEL